VTNDATKEAGLTAIFINEHASPVLPLVPTYSSSLEASAAIATAFDVER
jgi:hypothetical protein